MTWSRRVLYAAATSERLEALIVRSGALRRRSLSHARRYVAGESVAQALTIVRELVAHGFAVSIDRFGENVQAPDAIAAIVDEYRGLSRAVADVEGDVDLEVVPSTSRDRRFGHLLL